MDSKLRDSHPLMPGFRSNELWNSDWPRVLHDKLITGFSPLVCGMTEAPEVWSTLEVGGTADGVSLVESVDGRTLLLVSDGRFRCFTLSGRLEWSSDVDGDLVYFGDLRGEGVDYALLTRGPRLFLIEAKRGKKVWEHTFERPYVEIVTDVADIFPDRQGLAVAVFLNMAGDGGLLHFPPERDPEWVWWRTAVFEGEHPERYDHGCEVEFDLRDAQKPVLWNVRHHRCRSFDARTGEMLSSLVYEIGWGYRRNYGTFAVVESPDRTDTYVCVVGERVQTHVHVVRVGQDGKSELVWQEYYGEVYEKPGVAVMHLYTGDIDGDGKAEVVYNVRDPESDLHSFVRVRDVESGRLKAQLPDMWGVAAFDGGGSALSGFIVAFRAPGGEIPDRGELHLMSVGHEGRTTLEPIEVFPSARIMSDVEEAPAGGRRLILSVDENGSTYVEMLLIGGDERGRQPFRPLVRARKAFSGNLRALASGNDPREDVLLWEHQGSLTASDWWGNELWSTPLRGGPLPALSAADIDRDDRAELFAATASGDLRVFGFERDEEVCWREAWSCPFSIPIERWSPAARPTLSPLLYDLTGSGEYALLAPTSTPDGFLALQAHTGDGTLLWERVLEVPTGDGAAIVSWNAGDFLGRHDAGVVVCVAGHSRKVEGTYFLEGKSGRILWYKDIYREGQTVRAYRAMGIPTAYDFDGDGVEEIGMDLYSYMAYLRGRDGEFVYLHGSPNVWRENPLFAAALYNSFVPVFKNESDESPHWFVPLGTDTFGLMHPDPSTGVWREQVSYDVPEHAALVDVDGDGVIEIGYVLRNSSSFVCRNLWTGDEKWRLDLNEVPSGPVICADVDGDGKGEFLIGRSCIGTNEEGQGEIRWTSPVPFGWAAIADVDGDGLGEIACASRGRVHILKAASAVD